LKNKGDRDNVKRPDSRKSIIMKWFQLKKLSLVLKFVFATKMMSCSKAYHESFRETQSQRIPDQ